MKRRQYLINRRFQFRWTAIITLAGGLTAAAFATLLWVELGEQDRLIEESASADLKLKRKSQDVVVLLLNMPGVTKKESAKHKATFAEITKAHQHAKKTKASLLAHNRTLRLVVIGVVAMISVALFFWAILLTHRVAGPMFVIERHLRDLKEQGYVQLRPLRRKDEMKDVYAAFSEAMEEHGLDRAPGETEREGNDS